MSRAVAVKQLINERKKGKIKVDIIYPFAAGISAGGHWEKHKPSYLQIPFSRGLWSVELTSPTTARIVRLISCDLNDYLQPHFQPGREIRLKWAADS